jgi:hypothetical protein
MLFDRKKTEECNLSMSNEPQDKDERSQLAEHLDALQAILKNTPGVIERTALEKVIVYLGNRLADILEDEALVGVASAKAS